MMLQQQATGPNDPQQKIAHKLAHPRRLDIFFHLFKTLRLVKALTLDRRIPVHRKLLFFGTVGGLLVVLLFPDLISEAFLTAILPVVGTITGVPIDAGFDWLALALVGVNLLRYFPAEVVTEHYQNIFGR
jgi:hypothetical protein